MRREMVKTPYGADYHDIYHDVRLGENAELHRFTNPAGRDFSAIYEGDFEIMSADRADEEDMIKCYLEGRGD